MPLPKIDAPVYELDLPLSRKHIRFRPFLVKEQRNLLMAMESSDKDDIQRNVKQVLINCTLTPDVDIDKLPILDIEYYFINLRARSVGEVVENRYKCENLVGENPCGNFMDVKFDLLDIKPEGELPESNIKLTDKITVQMRYPNFSTVNHAIRMENNTDIAFEMILDCIESVFDGEQYYYANEVSRQEMVEFIESLNQDQFAKIESFFENMPKLVKRVDVTCKKCGFEHQITMQGLESFFG